MRRRIETPGPAPAGGTEHPVGCRICGSSRLSLLVEAEERFLDGPERQFRVSWCAECRCGTTQIVPDDEYWKAAYPEQYFRKVLGVGPHLDRRDQLAYVEAAAPVRGARVLEIGCSAGDLLGLLRDRGAAVVGVEPGEVARRIARSRGLDVVASLLDVQGGPFDLVVLFDVLEHLPTPAGTLRWAAERLAPSGRIVVGVPNIESIEFRLLGKRWFALELPRHLTHFSPRAIERLARAAGLRVGEILFPRASHFVKSFVDARLKDSRFRQTGAPLARAALWVVERALFALGNRPSLVAYLARA